MKALVEIRGVEKRFAMPSHFLSREKPVLHALNGVDAQVRQGEAFCVVGESGCGKTTVGRTVLRLIEPTEGTIRIDGDDITNLPKQELRRYRREMQIIFQDPYSSLNPRKTIRSTLEEPMRIHGIGDATERFERIASLMEKVELRRDDLHKFPHEFSGGQRQRIGIARALVLEPQLIVADEPVSALDVSIQSQVLNLLVDLQRELALTYVFISHDLTVVKYISDRVAVMYLGRIVEIADAKSIYAHPAHPYTQALLASLPIADPRQRTQRQPLEGDVPNPSRPPPGCAFHTRCPHARDICMQQVPVLEKLSGGSDHQAACHFTEELRT